MGSPGDLPNLGIKPVSSALAGGFFTNEPPEKPCMCNLETSKTKQNLDLTYTEKQLLEIGGLVGKGNGNPL